MSASDLLGPEGSCEKSPVSGGSPAGRSDSLPDIAMKTADFGNLHDRAHLRPLDWPPIRGVVREGVHDLLGRPVCGGVLGHVEVDHTPAMVGEHDEDKEHPQARWAP